MGYSIKIEELKKVSYLDLKGFGNDLVAPLFPCYKNGEWEMWLYGGDQLINIKGIPTESLYFSKERENELDGYMSFFDWFYKFVNYKDMNSFIQAIYEDIQNLASSIEKLDFIFLNMPKDNLHTHLRRFAVTELEYIVTTCRSVFDLLQEVVYRLWSHIQLHGVAQKKKLKQTFSEMVLFNSGIATKEKIEERLGFKSNLTDFYERNKDFFYWLRNYRDKIVHGGKTEDLIYILENGFAISVEREPFKSIHIWNEHNTQQPNNLGSVRSLTSYLVYETLKVIEDFTHTITQTIEFPCDIAPDNHIFVRGGYIHKLLELENCISKSSWIEMNARLDEMVMEKGRN